MLLHLLPATVEGRLGLVSVLTLALLLGFLGGVRLLRRKEPLSKRRGILLLLGLLVILVGIWWLLQARVVVAGWHTIGRYYVAGLGRLGLLLSMLLVDYASPERPWWSGWVLLLTLVGVIPLLRRLLAKKR